MARRKNFPTRVKARRTKAQDGLKKATVNKDNEERLKTEIAVLEKRIQETYENS